TMSPGIVHQDLSHESRGHGNKMGAILRRRRATSHQTQVDFVHQCGTLQRMPRTLALQIVVGHRTKVVIHERDKGFERGLVSRSPLQKKLSDGTRSSLWQRRTPGTRLRGKIAPGST